MSQCVKLIMLVKRDQQINKDRREERIRLLYRAEVRRQLQRRSPAFERRNIWSQSRYQT